MSVGLSRRIGSIPLAGIFILSMPISLYAEDWGVEPKVTGKEAPSLVQKALRSKTAYEYDEPMPEDEFIRVYEMGKYEGINAYYAVNHRTGDVFDVTVCSSDGAIRKTSVALRKAQMEIRKRFSTKELKQFARLHNLIPCTRDGDG